MNDFIVNKICFNNLNKYPDKIKRFEIDPDDNIIFIYHTLYGKFNG